ncbi:MAG: TniB family NTP-binding protein [Mesorhizobium sp.]|jgi:hypothetical protein
MSASKAMQESDIEMPATIAALVDLGKLRPAARSSRKLKKLQIPHARFLEVIEQVAQHHLLSDQGSEVEAGCLLLFGKTGAGKSVALRYYARQFPKTRGPRGMIRRVLYLQVPSGADKPALQRRILFRLGVPIPPRTTQDELTMLIDLHLRLQGVELLILDEFNHLADLRSSEKQYFAADMLKELTNFNSCQLVFAGLDSSISVLIGNPQLLRRRSHSHEVKPYAWDDEAEREAFKTFLDEFARNMPFRILAPLADWGEQLSIASWGLVGISAVLLIRATEIAVKAASPNIDLFHLAEAFDELKPRGTRGNPFSGTKVRFPPNYLRKLMEGVESRSGLSKRKQEEDA